MKLLKSKFVWLVVVLVALRIAAPYIIKDQLNKYLATFSPNYIGHIEDFRMSLWRGAYGIENLEMTLREKPIKFLQVKDTDVSIAWRELFQRLEIKTDIKVDQAKLLYSDYVLKKLSQNTSENLDSAKDAGSTLFPINIERIEIARSDIESSDFFGVTDKLPVVVTDVNGQVLNLTPNEKRQVSHFKFGGNLMSQTSPIEIDGMFNRFIKPIDWEVRVKANNFDLRTTNPWMYHVAPLTFKKGTLNIWSEVKSTHGKIEGYAKPFVTEVEMMGDEKDFKGFKQFGIEIGLAALNLFFRSSQDKTTACKFEFKYENQKFEWSFWQVLKSLFKNGYKEPLNKGFDQMLAKEKAPSKKD